MDLEDCSVDDLKMEAKTVDTVGQGLYATEDISPSQVLLEVPWEHILVVNVRATYHRLIPQIATCAMQHAM